MSAIRITSVIDQLLLGVAVMRFPFGFAHLHRACVAVIPDRLARTVRPGRAGPVALLKRLGVGSLFVVATPVGDRQAGGGEGVVRATLGAAGRVVGLPLLVGHQEVRERAILSTPRIVDRPNIIEPPYFVFVLMIIKRGTSFLSTVLKNFSPSVKRLPSVIRSGMIEFDYACPRHDRFINSTGKCGIEEVSIFCPREIDAELSQSDFPLFRQTGGSERKSDKKEGEDGW